MSGFGSLNIILVLGVLTAIGCAEAPSHGGIDSGGGSGLIGGCVAVSTIGSVFCPELPGGIGGATGLGAILNHRSPVPADRDGDGLPDVWELRYGLDPDEPNGGTDTDGDGLSDYDEFLAGTDPKDSSSLLRPFFQAGGTVRHIEFHSVPGRIYRIWSTLNLAPGSWELRWIGTGSGRPFHWEDRSDGPMQFYKTTVTPYR